MPNTKKVAILGGGIGALSTALELTSVPDWKDRYEITIYTLGWRLGGKAASSRRGSTFRIEEHGLHIWFGFYENAFAQMHRCFDELNRPAHTPLSTCVPIRGREGDEAFKPSPYSVNEEFYKGRWYHWPVESHVYKGSVPGKGSPYPSLAELMSRLIHWMWEAWKRLFGPDTGLVEPSVDLTSAPGEIYQSLQDDLGSEVPPIHRVPPQVLLNYAEREALALNRNSRDVSAVSISSIEWVVRQVRALAQSLTDFDDPVVRRAFVIVDLVATTILGIIVDKVFFHGFDQLDDREFDQWLDDHGASELARRSSVLRATYDAVFGFLGGDWNKEVLAAGTALKCGVRMMVGYKGAFVWLMQAGMGETVVVPYYEVLRNRGVHFRFFTDVRALHLSDDRRRVSSVTYRQQATPTAGLENYKPLARHGNFAYWPSVPDYTQLVEGADIEAMAQKNENVNLESYWTAWPGVGRDRELVEGQDYDLLVLAIPVGCHGDICEELIRHDGRWADMVAKVKTTRTMAAQLWMKPTLEGLGWRIDFDGDNKPDPMMIGGYERPLGVWADMSHLLASEDWTTVPQQRRPHHLAYFCGPMKDLDMPDEPRDHHDFPGRASDWLRRFADDFFRNYMPWLWPINPNNPQPWDWARVADQFYRVNVDPSERYVLSVAGSTKARLRSGESGFENLFLAGDWTRTGVNAGCIEAAVMSGMQASRAISGFPRKVVGENDLGQG